MRRFLGALADLSFDMYRHPLEALARHPEIPHAIVDYRDLVADPAATIERVYEQLDLTLTPEYREVLLAEGKRARKHATSHSYSLEEFGLEADAIQTRLADLFERFGWDDEAARGPANEGGS